MANLGAGRTKANPSFEHTKTKLDVNVLFRLPRAKRGGRMCILAKAAFSNSNDERKSPVISLIWIASMAKGPPKLVALNHDDYHAEYVGHTKDGRQFFLTTPFVPAIGQAAGREFIALYLFDQAGALVSATIDDLGTRSTMDEAARIARRDELLASLGELKYRRIKIAPFKIERFGVEFGFIPQAPEEEGEDWSVIVEPGNFMCFWPPWSSGDYDT